MTNSNAHCCAPLMSPESLAAYLDVPVRTLYKWRETGAGPTAHRVGKHLRYRRADVDAWLAAHAA